MADRIPPYPRIPHLVATRAATSDDRVLPASERDRLLRESVWVEEKLDGANVSITFRDGQLTAGTRGGTDTMDRGGIRGRVLAWAWRRFEAISNLLADGETLYGEWLGTPMAISYPRAPDSLVVLDIWSAAHGFSPARLRDRRCEAAGLPTPPFVFQGVLGTLARLEDLAGQSAYGDDLAEGLILRLERAGEPVLRAKWVRPDYQRPTDDALRGRSARA